MEVPIEYYRNGRYSVRMGQKGYEVYRDEICVAARCSIFGSSRDMTPKWLERAKADCDRRHNEETTSDDRDVLDVEAHHPIAGTMRYEKVRQDRRTYYRLTTNGKRGGALTDLDHARLAIAYWRIKGWI